MNINESANLVGFHLITVKHAPLRHTAQNENVYGKLPGDIHVGSHRVYLIIEDTDTRNTQACQSRCLLEGVITQLIPGNHADFELRPF